MLSLIAQLIRSALERQRKSRSGLKPLLERFLVDAKVFTLVTDALDQLPPATLQQRFCGARTAIDVVIAQTSGL
jgi:hypothetical protein